jgi:gluconolactonase
MRTESETKPHSTRDRWPRAMGALVALCGMLAGVSCSDLGDIDSTIDGLWRSHGHTRPAGDELDRYLRRCVTGRGTDSSPLYGVAGYRTLARGYFTAEGPQWRAATNDLVFTEPQNGTILRYNALSGRVSVLESGLLQATGLALAPNGEIIAAEMVGRRITQIHADGTRQVLAETFDGYELNSPNDLTVRADGTIYFTDPPFGDIRPAVRRMPYNAVWRLAPDGTLMPEWRGDIDATRPNGIALTSDDRTMYVTDTGRQLVMAFDVDPVTGALSGERIFVASTEGTPDGIAVDTAGNVFVATVAGVQAFAPDGTLWGTLPIGPSRATNLTFGGAHGLSMFVTTQESLVRVEMCIPGRL